MTSLSTFLESLFNFLSKKMEKHYRICYSQGEKRCQSLKCQKHSLKKQSETKLIIKPTWSEKMTVLSTFLKSLSNFLFNNRKKTLENFIKSERKAVSKFEMPETQFER